jgi:ubiquinone/menaquinone biosynthesis C-methylase UbiE
VTAPPRDRWAEWLLERRHGGDPDALEATLSRLGQVRDRVLEAAEIREGEVVLDVGCGDGLIAFGALDRVGESGRVVFSDVSQDLLDVCRERAAELGLLARCDFVRSAAEELAAVPDESVDVLTTRSVLIYLPFAQKQRAFDEFHRVLRSGGRAVLWEPINRFPQQEDSFWGIDAAPISELVEKLGAAAEPDESLTLVDFDERDLLVFAEEAGFAEVRLEYEARIEARSLSWDAGRSTWEAFVRASPNPHALTLEEAMEEAFTPEERAEFEAYIRPRFEAREGTSRSAFALLKAVKR